MFQFYLMPYDAMYKKHFYVFTQFSKKKLFLEPKKLSSTRLENLTSVSYCSNIVRNRCLKQQLYSHCATLTQVNSSLLKFWFSELSLVGLGFRFSVKNFGSSFRLNIGHSHSILLPISPKLFLLKRKKRCLLIGSNFTILRKLVYQVLKLRKTNKYKTKGLQLKGVVFKLKPGKRSK